MPSCTTVGGCTGSPIDCRGTANCQSGAICCLSPLARAIEAECTVASSCTGGVQLCADGDCPAGQTCTGGLCVRTGVGFDGGFPGFDGGIPGFDGGFFGFDGGFPIP